MTLSHCHHIAIKVRDVEAVSLFYKNVLGLKQIARHLYKDGRLRAVWFDLSGTILMIESSAPATKPQPSTHVVAFTIKKEDRQKWQKRLQDAGVVIASKSDYSLYFTDPEGNRLALSHYPKA